MYGKKNNFDRKLSSIQHFWLTCAYFIFLQKVFFVNLNSLNFIFVGRVPLDPPPLDLHMVEHPDNIVQFNNVEFSGMVKKFI